MPGASDGLVLCVLLMRVLVMSGCLLDAAHGLDSEFKAEARGEQLKNHAIVCLLKPINVRVINQRQVLNPSCI